MGIRLTGDITISGAKTTEFWMTTGFGALCAYAIYVEPGNWAPFLACAGVVATYIYSRQEVKKGFINNFYGDYAGRDDIEVGSISDSDAISLGQDSESESKKRYNPKI